MHCLAHKVLVGKLEGLHVLHSWEAALWASDVKRNNGQTKLITRVDGSLAMYTHACEQHIQR